MKANNGQPIRTLDVIITTGRAGLKKQTGWRHEMSPSNRPESFSRKGRSTGVSFEARPPPSNLKIHRVKLHNGDGKHFAHAQKHRRRLRREWGALAFVLGYAPQDSRSAEAFQGSSEAKEKLTSRFFISASEYII